MTNKQINQGIVIDTQKCNRMQGKILWLEHNNRKDNGKTDSQMKEAIKKIIEEEANKCY